MKKWVTDTQKSATTGGKGEDMLVKGKTLNDIIDYLDVLEEVQIWQIDINLPTSEKADEAEMVYEGSVLDIPWYLTRYYLVNSYDAEAIGTCINDDGKRCLSICLAEDLDRITEE